MATTTSTNAGIAPYADTWAGSYELQRVRVEELRHSVARHPHCELRKANLAQALDEMDSRHFQAWPREYTDEERATLAQLAALLS